jgi:serine phosphatase RsbU (regulator of sigma subunit)
MGKALILDAASAGRFGGAHQALVPFLARGASAVVIPIATPNDLLGTLKLLSLDPERPITDDAVEIGLTLAAQAALAIDNARLYQQQKAFSDAMQRSLLPRSRPDMPGVEVGEVYESSARVDVGGDVYDFLVLDDGRLAVVMGDVTGHGVDAASDMAMAKFVFRSLAREHPEPGEFLTAANEVVCGEIAAGKFITMLYLTLDASTGVVTCAGAGHPPPRIVLPDGEVRSLDARGLALGIEEGQRYDEVRETLPAGAAVVLYTDGVIEERNNGEFYGTERLDATLSRLRGIPAPELAEAVLAECRKFGGGDLADDCALVVIKRTAA